MTAFAQLGDRRLHRARLLQARSENQVSKWTPKRSRVASIRLRIASTPRRAERVEVVGVDAGRGQLLGELGDVLALVAVLGRLGAAHPGRDRLARTGAIWLPVSLT